MKLNWSLIDNLRLSLEIQDFDVNYPELRRNITQLLKNEIHLIKIGCYDFDEWSIANTITKNILKLIIDDSREKIKPILRKYQDNQKS